MNRGLIVAVCVAASAVALSGCTTNVVGTAAIDPNAEPWLLPLGEDDLNSVLLDIGGLNDAASASGLEFTREDSDLVDTADTITNQECNGAFNAGELTVYQDSEYTVGINEVATEPDSVTDNRHWVQQVAVLFPSTEESEAFFEKSLDDWESCSGQTLSTVSDGDTSYAWEFEDVKAEDTTISMYMVQTDSTDPWGCDHTMSVVSNVIVEGIVCSDAGAGQAAELNTRLVQNASKH